MHWMNPAGAWALTALAAILVLYFLKQRVEPTPVSSTYLWRKALATLEADRPFQRLRRNLLLFLQLLAALLFALSIMRPMTPGTEAGELVFVFDLSASMQAEGEAGTRFDAAIADAQRRIAGLPEGARVSVLTAGARVRQPLARTTDLLRARRTIEALAPENGSADLSGALSLALALQRELEGVQLIVYSDQTLPEGGLLQPYLGGGQENRAILSLAANDTAAVARIANYGAAAQVTVECYAGDNLVDIRSLDLEAGETASVQFDLPAPAATVVARLTGADALPADDTRRWVSRETGRTTVLLAGQDNIFLEKALALRTDISLLKTTTEEVGAIASGALTVVDGPLPEVLPAQGALLLVNPDVAVGAAQETPATLSAASGALADTLNQHLSVDEIQVSAWREVTTGTPIWLANGLPVLTIAEEDGRRVARLGFDLHASNLPLLKEFPVWVQQLLAYLAPEPLGAGFSDADCGDAFTITPQSFAQEAFVETPSGRRLPLPVTGGTFSDTNETGIYQLVQVDEAGEETRVAFALHIPAAESDVRQAAYREDAAAGLAGGLAVGREWTPYLLCLLLSLMLLEWWVYRRGI